MKSSEKVKFIGEGGRGGKLPTGLNRIAKGSISILGVVSEVVDR